MAKYNLEIDDGAVGIDVNNQNGELIGTIYINPTDFNIIERAERAQNRIRELLEGLETDGESAEKIKQIDKAIREQVDNIFNYEVSDIIFKNNHCLSMKNGITFVERLIDSMSQIIQKILEREVEESNDRMSKYTAPYLMKQ
ncbi:MAG: hypothetical protein HFI34_06815 [Lachnospiraceae bacterium]|nr:hypothetical protein [Lachnospiraceae bacterium]